VAPGPTSWTAALGNDTLLASGGNDTLIGGGGTDTYSLAATAAAATVNLATGTSSSAETGTDTLTGIENVIGGSGATSSPATARPTR
jgi:Ca2+-binding RTX toxin-like protein